MASLFNTSHVLLRQIENNCDRECSFIVF